MIFRNRDNGFNHPLASEITPQAVYQNRRQWLLTTAALGGGMAVWAGRDAWAQGAPATAKPPGRLAALPGRRSAVDGAVTMEALTSYEDASSYNNYYEFGTDKSDPVDQAKALKPRPWTVAVEGLVNKPGTFDLDALLKLSPMEERIYRLRCVEIPPTRIGEAMR